jgi:hypothetical protein
VKFGGNADSLGHQWHVQTRGGFGVDGTFGQWQDQLAQHPGRSSTKVRLHELLSVMLCALRGRLWKEMVFPTVAMVTDELGLQRCEGGWSHYLQWCKAFQEL